jgi:hypothetical protein
MVPQSWNRYGYTLNNPVNFVDPLGLFLAAPGPPSVDVMQCNGPVIYLFGIVFACLGGVDSGGESRGDQKQPKPKRNYPGLSQSRLNILSRAKDDAVALLNSGNCKANLASETIRGRHIDGDRVERELINLFIKPEGLDESVPGVEPFSGATYAVFDGSASELERVRAARGGT